jgi:hypothetical protein
VARAAELARKYGKVLAWARRERLSNDSSTCRVLAARIDHILTNQVVKASSVKFVSVNDIYVVMWELENLVEQIDEMLLQGRVNDFVIQLLQDSITLDSVNASPLMTAKYELFKDWLILQRNMLVAWLCYTKLPSFPGDFWIEPSSSSSSSVTSSFSKRSGSNVWNEYVVVKERLPALMISEALAAKILFIGVSVKVLDLAKKKTKPHELWIQRTLSMIFHQTPTHQGFCTFFGHWDVLEATAKVNEMEKWAASGLHSLIMVEHQFLSHLHVLREFFFLQDGFFYRTLFSLATNLLELPPGINAEHDINVFFQESAAAKQFLGEDVKSKLFQNLRFTFAPSYTSEKVIDKDKAIGRVWSNLSLDYTTEWPLNLILSPETLLKYNEIFQFLFQVKRIQIGLQNGWKLLSQPNLPLRLTHRFQLLRNQMAFFIDTLSQYLHVDVFSSEIQTLDERLEGCKDFEDLQTTHQRFLSQVLLQCFLSVPAFKRTFASIFDIIIGLISLLRDFVHHTFQQPSEVLASSSTSISTPKSQENFTTDLEATMKEWFKHNNLLFTLLSGVKGQAPHLHYLLLLLDYSLFWSNGKSLLDLEKEHEIDWTETKPPRMHHFPPSSSSSSSSHDSVTSSSATSSKATSSRAPMQDSQAGSMRLPRVATRTSRARAASAEAPPVASPPRSKSSAGGPRPELLARLMKKTNK